jgi:hypothetical protein
MSIIGFLHAENTDRPVAPRRSRMGGSYTGTGYAGWMVEDAVIVCNSCAEARYNLDDAHPVFTDSETRYPGTTCMDHTDCEACPDQQGDALLPETMLVNEGDLFHVSDREMWSLDVDSKAPESAVSEVLRQRDRIRYEAPDWLADTRAGHVSDQPNVPEMGSRYTQNE